MFEKMKDEEEVEPSSKTREQLFTEIFDCFEEITNLKNDVEEAKEENIRLNAKFEEYVSEKFNVKVCINCMKKFSPLIPNEVKTQKINKLNQRDPTDLH